MNRRSLLMSSLLTLSLLVAGIVVSGGGRAAAERNLVATDPAIFVPLVVYQERRQPGPAPQVVDTVTLTDAYCPHGVYVNPLNGLAYTANVGVPEGSPSEIGTVSFLKDGQFLGTTFTGEWPTIYFEAKTDSEIVFHPHQHGDIAVYEGGTLSGFIPVPVDDTDLGPRKREPFSVVYNKFNNYIYVAFTHVQYVTIYDGTTYELVADVDMQSGALREMAVDPRNGLVYVANWEYGRLYVMKDLGIHQIINDVGVRPFHLAFDPSGYLYVSHDGPTFPTHNISVWRDGQPVAAYTTASTSRDIAVDPYDGTAYVINDHDFSLYDDTVSVLREGELLGDVTIGDRPWDVTVNPATGYAYVVNKDSDTVSVLLGAQLVATLPTEDQPHGVAVDPLSGYAYVVNRLSHIAQDPFGRDYLVCHENPTVTVLR